MKKTRLWIGVLMLIGGSHIAYAGYQETGDTAHEKKCESMSQGDFSISGLDANKDGVITKEEYLAGNPRNTEKIFNH